MKYKGYNVPDVGDFVSEETTASDIADDYCKKGYANKCPGDCQECLFPCKEIVKQWHEARVKEKNERAKV